MVYKVVATKLTEEEHTKLLDECNKEGCTPSSYIKNAIIKSMEDVEKKSKELTLTDLEEMLKKK